MLTNEAENRESMLICSIHYAGRGTKSVLNTLAVKLAYLGRRDGIKLCPGLEYTTVKERVHGDSVLLYWIRLWVGPSCPWVIIV